MENLGFEQRENLMFMGIVLKGLVHNINTPLSAILGRSEMLRIRLQKLNNSLDGGLIKEMKEIDKSLKDISLIIENTDRISEIIRNAMQKSINEQSQGIQPINLSLLLREELQFFDADLTFKHEIEKVYHLSESLPYIKGNYSHFSYSFRKIIENAKKSMEKTDEKKLTISVHADEKHITASFHDTGCGFTSHQKEGILAYLNNLNKNNEYVLDKRGGIYHIGRLLRPYKPVFEISSRPGDTTFVVHFPLLA